MPHEVMISYATADVIAAVEICKRLEADGISCWIASRDQLPGVEFGAGIIDAIESCQCMVLVFSAAADASPNRKTTSADSPGASSR